LLLVLLLLSVLAHGWLLIIYFYLVRRLPPRGEDLAAALLGAAFFATGLAFGFAFGFGLGLAFGFIFGAGFTPTGVFATLTYRLALLTAASAMRVASVFAAPNLVLSAAISSAAARVCASCSACHLFSSFVNFGIFPSVGGSTSISSSLLLIQKR
jgi:hypothetical protein